MIKRAAFIVGILFSLSACSGAIHKESSLKGVDPIAITVDARQRVLLSQWDPRNDPAALKDPAKATKPMFRRFCAEPSPDAFTVLGVAASGSGNLALEPASKNVSAALQAAFSSNETGATIARTQTINMLREMMFRTCERYLSGAISDAQFQTIAARDQRIMVSILAIEQLTGAITPPPIAIGSSGNTSTGFDPTEIAKAIAEQKAALKEADDKLVSAKKEYDTANTGDVCVPLLPKAEADVAGGDKAKYKSCIDTHDAYTTAQEEAEAAKAIYDGLLSAAARGQGVASASTASMFYLAGTTPRKEAVTQVAGAVKRIVELTFKQDETLLLCLQILSDPQEKFASIVPTCTKYLDVKVIADRQDLELKSGISLSRLNAIREEVDNRYDFRANISDRISVCVTNPDKLNSIKGLFSTQNDYDEFLTAAKTRKSFDLYLFDLGDVLEDNLTKKLDKIC